MNILANILKEKQNESVRAKKKIYGTFNNIAITSQKIKDMYYIDNAQENDSVINEAFEMIAHKLARIINGSSRYIDNWRDIAGYAQLVVEYLENEAKEAIDSKITYYKKEPGRGWQEFKDD